MENLVKKINFFASFGIELKKSAKIHKNEKTQHLIRCFKSKKQFKIIFLILCQFLGHFEQKWQKKPPKNVFFCNFFSKNCGFWSKFNINNVFLVKFPFWKCILLCTLINSLRSIITKWKRPNVTCGPPLMLLLSKRSWDSCWRNMVRLITSFVLKISIRKFRMSDLKHIMVWIEWLYSMVFVVINHLSQPIHVWQQPYPFSHTLTS